MEYSLVLGGGGAKGSYEIGVFKALKEMNINISSVYGTSIGALNGAMIIQGDIEKAQKLWSEIKANDIMDIKEDINSLLQKGGISTLEFMIHIISSKGVDITPFRRLLEDIIDEEAIRNSPIDFGIVTFSLNDFTPLKLNKNDIPKGKLIDYLIASSALPAFKKHTIDNKIFIDGAFCDNIPISLAINDKRENIIVVDIISPGIVEKVDTSKHNIITIRNPYELRGSVLNFNSENILSNMELGYLDGKKAFGQLKGYKYYFNLDGNIHDYTQKYISSLMPCNIKSIYSCFGVEINHREINISKVILDAIFTTLRRNSGDKDVSKSGFFRGAIEIVADLFNIPKIKIYKIDEIIKEIIDKTNDTLSKLNNQQYLDYIKNSVLLTDRKKVRKSLLDTINRKTNVIYYAKSCKDGKTNISFRKIVSKVYPRLAIGAVFLLFLDKEGYIKL